MRLCCCLGLILLVATTAVATPDPPTSLTICASGDSVMLRWSTSLDATSYRVYFAETLGGPVSVLCETTDTTAVDSLLQGKRFYYVVATVPNNPPVIAPIPDQQLVEDSLQVSPINLRDYITDESPFDGLSIVIIQPTKLTLGLENGILSVLSLASDSNGLDSAVVHVTDPEGATAEQTVRYSIAERTDLRLMVWDFDRVRIDSAKVRVIAGTDSTDYMTTDGWMHASVIPCDSVTVKAWRSTPSQWGNDTLSSYIRTERIPALTDCVDSVQVQTWNVCDSMNVSPPNYEQWQTTLCGWPIRINGVWTAVLGGINPQTINLDTIWYCNVHPYNGDTTFQSDQWRRDSLMAEAQRIKDTQLFPDSPFPTFYQPPIGTPEPFIIGYGPSRQHLHIFYMGLTSTCWIAIYHDIPNNASTTRSGTEIGYPMHPICIRQETGTILACTNGAPDLPAMAGKSILHETSPSPDYTYADKETFRVWNQIPTNTRIEWIYGLP